MEKKILSDSHTHEMVLIKLLKILKSVSIDFDLGASKVFNVKTRCTRSVAI